MSPVATQASKALPPFSNIDMPTADAIQCVEATTPKVPLISGRVVNMMGSASGIWAEISPYAARELWRRRGADAIVIGARELTLAAEDFELEPFRHQLVRAPMSCARIAASCDWARVTSSPIPTPAAS